MGRQESSGPECWARVEPESRSYQPVSYAIDLLRGRNEDEYPISELLTAFVELHEQGLWNPPLWHPVEKPSPYDAASSDEEHASAARGFARIDVAASQILGRENEQVIEEKVFVHETIGWSDHDERRRTWITFQVVRLTTGTMRQEAVLRLLDIDQITEFSPDILDGSTIQPNIFQEIAIRIEQAQVQLR